MSSAIDLYLSIITTEGGIRDQHGDLLEPRVSITGDGPSPFGSLPYAVDAGEQKEIYDFERDGDFEVALIEAAGEDVEVWWQVGTPSDGASTKGDLIWQCVVVPAGRFFMIPSSQARTNTTAADHIADSTDAPGGATSTTEDDARIWLIVIANNGTDDATVKFIRRA